ncbi:MAG: response regulator [Desulfonatronovibrio sp. MSAO_Bac4]|nr:MAG: response regulator [Desulfonatronovibrio sp. MSAO_Bac4]
MPSDDKDQTTWLRDRISYLEKSQRTMLESLESAATGGEFKSSPGKYKEAVDVLQDFAPRIMRLGAFRSVGLWHVDENTSDFTLGCCIPESSRQYILTEFQRLTEEGMISLALTGEKPLTAAGSGTKDRHVIQAMTTASRTRGLFVGSLKTGQSMHDITLPLLMILGQNCASSLEALELYRLLRIKNQDLQDKKEQLELREKKRLHAEMEKEQLQAQLVQSQKLESVGRLTGGIAHDFNNMLQAMNGNIELILKTKPEDHPDVVRLKSVNESINRAAQLVSQLLLFSRKTGYRRELVNLNQEVEGVARILERTIPRMITLELRLDPETWPALGDPVQIEQVLLNLSNNAVDAMPDGGILSMKTDNVILDNSFVAAHPGSNAGPHVLLTVTDTGCGMNKETLSHIFDPFFTTKEIGKGTGLGLASVYGIVKAHGGYIQCYSETGKGTTFRVYLPSREHERIMAEEQQPESVPIGGDETILIVDDEPEIQELNREAMEDFGYKVICASCGEQALEIYREHGQSIALILMDLNMPGMGGYKCLEKLLELNPAVNVVIVSGNSANAHGKEPSDFGAKAFLSKPYQMKDLAGTVRKVLDIDA